MTSYSFARGVLYRDSPPQRTEDIPLVLLIMIAAAKNPDLGVFGIQASQGRRIQAPYRYSALTNTVLPVSVHCEPPGRLKVT
jgi:hypothetical protein